MRESEQCPFVVLEVPSDMRVEGKPRFLFANKVSKTSNILFSGDKILHGIQFKEMQESGMGWQSRGRPPFRRFPPSNRGGGFGRSKYMGPPPPPPNYYRPKFVGAYSKPRFGWNPRKPFGYRGFGPRKFGPMGGRPRPYDKEEEEGERVRHYSGSSYGDERRPPPRGSPVYEDDERRSDVSEDSLEYHSSEREYSSPRKSSKSAKHHKGGRKRYADEDSDRYDDDDDESDSSRSSSHSYSAGKSPSRYDTSAVSKRYSHESLKRHKHQEMKSSKSHDKRYPQEPPEPYDKGSHYMPSSSSSYKTSAERSYKHFEKDPEKGKKPYSKKYPTYREYLPPKKHYPKEQFSPGSQSKSSDEEHYERLHHSASRRYDTLSDSSEYPRPSSYSASYGKDKYFSHHKSFEKKSADKYAPSYERDFSPPFGGGGPSRSKYQDPRYSGKYPPPPFPQKKREFSPSSPDQPFHKRSKEGQQLWVQKTLSKVGNLKPFVNPSKTRQVVFLDIQSNPSFFHEVQGRLLPKGTFVCLFHGVVRGTIVPPDCPTVLALQRAECFFTHPDCNTPRGLALDALPPVALLLHKKLPTTIPFFILSKISFYNAVNFIKQTREVHFITMDSGALPRLLNYIE